MRFALSAFLGLIALVAAPATFASSMETSFYDHSTFFFAGGGGALEFATVLDRTLGAASDAAFFVSTLTTDRWSVDSLDSFVNVNVLDLGSIAASPPEVGAPPTVA